MPDLLELGPKSGTPVVKFSVHYERVVVKFMFIVMECILCDLAVCWSSLFKFHGDAATELSKHMYSVLAVALKDGHIALWTVSCPATHTGCVCFVLFRNRWHVIC